MHNSRPVFPGGVGPYDTMLSFPDPDRWSWFPGTLRHPRVCVRHKTTDCDSSVRPVECYAYRTLTICLQYVSALASYTGSPHISGAVPGLSEDLANPHRGDDRH